MRNAEGGGGLDVKAERFGTVPGKVLWTDHGLSQIV